MSTTGRKGPKAWSKRGPDGPWDAIVIGSGMGGMTTAAMLAKMGKKVLVLEQHYVPGGFTHVFKRPGYVWDVGVHAVGEVTDRSLTGRLLTFLTDGALEWASLGPVYDEFWFPDDVRIDFPDNPKQFRDNLLEAFPAEQKAIDEYLRLVREVAGGMKGYYLARAAPQGLGWAGHLLMARRSQKWLEKSTAEVIASLTDDPKLRTVFAAQWGYYGSPPSRSSFAIQALVVKHFLWGGYYPKGGAGEIARTLLGTVAAAGGWTRVSTDVEEILIERGRATGVRLAGGEEIRAKQVISAAGVMSTLMRLLPEEHREASWSESVTKLSPAPAHVCLYLGFEGDITTAGASAANKWFYETWDAEDDEWKITPEGELPRAGVLYCSFPSLKDPTHDPGEKVRHTGEVVTFVPWDAFEPWLDTRWKKRPEDYEALKQRLHDRLLEQFFENMPELRPMLKYAELSTPLSTHNFCRPVEGSIYGIEPTPERFATKWLKPKSPIPGLYFSGSEVSTVGVIGAMMGGVLAALAAEPMASMKMMRKLGM